MKCCHFGASSVDTIQPCIRLQCHFIQSHIVYVCLAVTCHLHFWQNDWDLLRATAVTRGWNRYRNKSQHRKLTLEKQTLLPPLQGFEPATFQSWVQCSNHWAILLPNIDLYSCVLSYFPFFHEHVLVRQKQLMIHAALSQAAFLVFDLLVRRTEHHILNYFPVGRILLESFETEMF